MSEKLKPEKITRNLTYFREKTKASWETFRSVQESSSDLIG